MICLNDNCYVFVLVEVWVFVGIIFECLVVVLDEFVMLCFVIGLIVVKFVLLLDLVEFVEVMVELEKLFDVVVDE